MLNASLERYVFRNLSKTWVDLESLMLLGRWFPLQWRHNGCDGISNHQPHNCLLKCLLRCRSKKTSKLYITGLCEGNSPVTVEFPEQMASNAEDVSIWWCHYAEMRPCNWKATETIGFCFCFLGLLAEHIVNCCSSQVLMWCKHVLLFWKIHLSNI